MLLLAIRLRFCWRLSRNPGDHVSVHFATDPVSDCLVCGLCCDVQRRSGGLSAIFSLAPYYAVLFVLRKRIAGSVNLD
jgi:hypothetical protein